MTGSDGPGRIILGGAFVDLWRTDRLFDCVSQRLGNSRPAAPLAISSANLDHIHHFGVGGRNRDDLDIGGPSPEWAVLLDGVPLVRRAGALTGKSWPRLAGSDLLPDFIALAEKVGASVGFLGGRTEMHESLRPVLENRYPSLKVAGLWSPARGELADPDAAAALAREVCSARVDLLVVGLGKPRQERWIQHHAVDSGARVLLAFGAAADFLAGMVERAPRWVQDASMEWFYRLLKEPRRLGRRYCVQAPPALWRLRTQSNIPSSSGEA